MIDTLPQSILNDASRLGFDNFVTFLTDLHLQQFYASASAEDNFRIESLYEVDDIVNQSQSPHVLSTSLFWIPKADTKADVPVMTKTLLQESLRRGLTTRYDPWEHYFIPLLTGAKAIAETRHNVSVRVYLAHNLSCLIPDLSPYCQIYLMKATPRDHNPGAMWRFLAIEDNPGLVSVIDADMMHRALDVLNETRALATSGVNTWRVTNALEVDSRNMFIYRPIVANRFGTSAKLPITELMKAFVWHLEQGTFARRVNTPRNGSCLTFGTTWPKYGIDETFLSAAVYPRLLPGGNILYARKVVDAPLLLALDIALTCITNPGSQFRVV